MGVIPLFRVHAPDGIGHRVEEVFGSGTVTEGALSDQLEKEVGELIGEPRVALVNSATSALTLAYRLCGVGPDMEVISSPMTCMATNEPIVNAGGRIVWADIEADTGNIDPTKLEGLITDRTRAVVAVHWAGQPFDLDAVCEVAHRHGVRVIADAAHALGATYGGRPIAQHADYTVFSFQAIKHLTTGDGGAITCRTDEELKRAKLLRWFGIDRHYPGPKWEQDIYEAGYKFHMNNVTAAIGLAQMPHVRSIIKAHQDNGAYYDAHIRDTKSVQAQMPCANRVQKLRRPAGTQSAHWVYTLLVDDPDGFKAFLAREGIAADRVHIRNDRYSVFAPFRADDRLPGVDAFCSRMMCIPVGWWLTPEDRDSIVRAVNAYGC